MKFIKVGNIIFNVNTINNIVYSSTYILILCTKGNEYKVSLPSTEHLCGYIWESFNCFMSGLNRCDLCFGSMYDFDDEVIKSIKIQQDTLERWDENQTKN